MSIRDWPVSHYTYGAGYKVPDGLGADFVGRELRSILAELIVENEQGIGDELRNIFIEKKG